MRIFGFSFFTILLFAAFYVLGRKYPNAIPVLNRI